MFACKNHCIFSDSEFDNLAEKLTQHATKTTQIEMAPWAKGHTVDVKDICTELKLETESNGRNVKDYKELFLSRVAKKTTLRSNSVTKILIKGRQGFGKTSLAKKIHSDWSKQILTTFDIVFLISMKLVRSDDEIENVIVQQTPLLRALNTGEEKIGDLLDNFGNRCLIILDGSSEDPENINCLLQSVRNRSSVLVTSPPSAVYYLHDCFDNIAEIQTLSDSQVKRYISLLSEGKPPVVSRLSVERFVSSSGVLSPLLLLFLCILADSGAFDAGETGAELGDIYFRLVRCLHNKYALSNFAVSGLNVVQTLGKIALRGFNEKRYSFSKKQIIEECGENILTNVFWVSSEGHSTDGSDTEGTISFVHSFFQYHFAFSYFVLSDKDTRTGTRFRSAFLTLPSFCDFCLQLLRTDTMIYGPEMRARAYTRVKLIFVQKMNYVDLNLTELLTSSPSIKMCSSFDIRYDSIAQLIQTALPMCKNIKHVILDNESLNFDLQTLQPFWLQLFSVQLFQGNIISAILPGMDIKFCSEKLVILTDTPVTAKVISLVDTFNGIGRSLHLYYYPEGDMVRHPLEISGLASNEEIKHVPQLKLSEFPLEYLNELHINPSERCRIASDENIGHAPHLQRLSLCNMDIDDSVYFVLSEAVTNDNLPNITDLSLAGSTVAGQLKQLFKPHLRWPSLVHLDLNNCNLAKNEVSALELARLGSLLPQLRSLIIHRSCVNVLPVLLVLPQITTLNLHSVAEIEYQLLVTFLNRGMLPELKELQVFVECNTMVYDTLRRTETQLDPQVPLIDSGLRNRETTEIDPTVNLAIERSEPLQLVPENFDRMVSQSLRHSFEPVIRDSCTDYKLQNLMTTALWTWFATDTDILRFIERVLDLDSQHANYWLNAFHRLYFEHIHIRTLKNLSLHQYVSSPIKLYTIARSAKCSYLETLDVSHSSGISGHLFILVSHAFPSLKALNLGLCGLISKDLNSLAKANFKNKLPSLRHLDISGNRCEYREDLTSLFEYGAKWESLTSFCVQHSSPYWLPCLGSDRVFLLLPSAMEHRSLLVVYVFNFYQTHRVVPHGTKGTGPEFITRPVYSRSQLRNDTNTV